MAEFALYIAALIAIVAIALATVGVGWWLVRCFRREFAEAQRPKSGRDPL